MAIHLSVEQRRKLRRLRADGMTVAEVAREIRCSLRTVKRVTASPGRREQRQTRWCPGPRRLSLQEREEISLGVRRGDSFTTIAARLGRSTSTVSREVNANGGRGGYRAWRGHDRAFERARRPKQSKLTCPRLANQVTEWLEEWWSPEEISRRLPIEFPDDPMMRVSHETIYQSIYVQGRGELRRELARCLRTGRATRRRRDRVETRGRIPGMVMISDRPAETDDRAVPGHWEGDLIIGKEGRSAVGTLVERTTGYLLLLHPSRRQGGRQGDGAIRHAVTRLPGEFFRTITWDQGKRWPSTPASASTPASRSTSATPQPLATSHEREHQRAPAPVSAEGDRPVVGDRDRARRHRPSLNNRPRKRLGFMKPSERLAELLAMTG